MAMRPVSAGERIEVLDVLRGAALFGIIAANMRGFSGPLPAYFDHTLMWTDTTSRIAQTFVDFFIQGKFITLFAFMFGIGFAIQMERADRSGVESRAFYVRRLAILFVLGLLHFLLIWWGDILAPYALMGFLLMLFRRRSQKTLLIWSAVLYAWPQLLAAVMMTLRSAGVQIPSPPATTPEELQRLIGVYGTGSYAEIVTQNFKSLPFMGFGLVFFYPRVLGIFLFGLWVWRQGIIRELPSKTDLLRRCQKHGLWIGVLFNALAIALKDAFHPAPMTPSVVGLRYRLADRHRTCPQAACFMHRHSHCYGRRHTGASGCGPSAPSAGRRSATICFRASSARRSITAGAEASTGASIRWSALLPTAHHLQRAGRTEPLVAAALCIGTHGMALASVHLRDTDARLPAGSSC